jgi:hypothetical protein
MDPRMQISEVSVKVCFVGIGPARGKGTVGQSGNQP